MGDESLAQGHTSPVDDAVRNRLTAISIANPSSDQETIDFFRGIGDEALPAIQEAITSGESDTRHRGVIALTYLLKPREYRDEEYRQAEQDIISMLLPLLADDNADIRKNVTGLLGSISWSQFPDIDTPVVAGLVKMLSDRDKSIREYAANLLIRIGKGSAVPEELRSGPDRLTID